MWLACNTVYLTAQEGKVAIIDTVGFQRKLKHIAGEAVPQLWYVLGRWHQLERSLALPIEYSLAASSKA